MMMPKDKKDKQKMPAAVLMMFGKAKPVRGSRTAKSQASKAKKAK